MFAISGPYVAIVSCRVLNVCNPDVGKSVFKSSLSMLVMGEIKLFKALNQLNQLLRKMINCFEELETQHAGKKCVNAPNAHVKTCLKQF